MPLHKQAGYTAAILSLSRQPPSLAKREETIYGDYAPSLRSPWRAATGHVESPTQWTRRKVPRKNLVPPVVASARYANPPDSAPLVSFSFPFTGSFSDSTNSTLTAANPCSLANLPPTGRRRTEGRTTGSRRAQDQFLWLRKWHIAAYPLTICFYGENQSHTLRSAELISTMVLERATHAGLLGRVAGREFVYTFGLSYDVSQHAKTHGDQHQRAPHGSPGGG
jgi:hypothetical protein